MRSKQRYRCKVCGLNFTDTLARGKPLTKTATTVLVYVSGLSMNRTATLLGLNTHDPGLARAVRRRLPTEARAARPAHPTDLLGHRCHRIRLGNDRIYQWDFERGGEALALEVPGAITIDDTPFVISLATAGAGLAYLPEPCVAPLVDQGALRVVLEEWSSTGPGFHVYYPSRRQLPTGLRLLIELIRELRPLGL